ncbi:hypothetical protein FPOA_27081 [Fusarium poae]|uniref:HTH CENPB-type domain-containing protein n=1 Tax=Fusarium poae TaxID=36050 RepID=A0A1B8A8I9_FUSPO|nr:hypothetical protein FPOA_27081 [Fusarium poae]
MTRNKAGQKHGVPQPTLSGRLRGVPPKSEVAHPAQLLPKSQESSLVAWILRQEALGYAPSHSQVRATVTALLRQQGREKPIGIHWLARFIKRHPSIKTKIGKRQEASRFNCFTPTAVNWYFDIREREYGWIKPDNIINVDEGGIMAGFGLDSLLYRAVTATGRLLKPGIIFKGKEIQQQWFVDELKQVADWYYITSENGWTDNHIAVEWLKEVYLPQTQPEDESDARLIILDGHRSHVSDEWMATLDKVNFIKAYAKAREVGMTKKNILSGWRVTGNWPISRRKALTHPEIQPEKKEVTPTSDGHRDGQIDSDNTPKTSRHIRDLGKNKTPSTRRRYSVISKGFEAQESKIASLSTRVASLEEEVGRLSRGKKRKAIPNPNRKFMTLAEALVAGDAISEPNQAADETEAVEEVIEVGGAEEDESTNSEAEELPAARTRAGRWRGLIGRGVLHGIAVEWLKEVYLPQTQPEDESDARLIILDGHGSHVSDEWMATCFLNNVYCCYLPAHCSHGLQPLDNGVFNASKAAYRKELQKLASLTDSAPVDKVNFIKAYAKAREVGMTKKNILSGWRVTGNWPISRRKALMHPEIQPDKKETTPGSDGHRDGQVDSDNTPKTSRHIRDLGKNKSPSTRRRYSVISKGFEAQESKIASLSTRIASLEEEVGRLSRGKKRKTVPNPNKKFITLAEVLATGDTISEPN